MTRDRIARAVLAAVAIALLAASCGTGPEGSVVGGTPTGAISSPAPTYPVPESGYGLPLSEPKREPDVTLTDQDGRPFELGADTPGRVMLLYFGYTHCPDICPGTLAAMAVALRGLPPEVREQVNVVFVTLDPARDTPEVLKTYMANFDDAFVGLTGPERRIAAVVAELGLPPATTYDLGGGEYGVGHPAQVLAFTSDGYAHVEYPFGIKVEMWQHDLPKLVEEGWEA
jgi:protein SCO1/2